MPDITRSDSNRSNASRPRVSFNRDVHVKRINGSKTANAYSLSLDGTCLTPTLLRKERPMTKKEMTKEAEVVLKQIDKISCSATSNISSQRNKTKKERKKSNNLFLAKLNKMGKRNISSSDVESGSSQELRIYKINDPIYHNNICINYDEYHNSGENKNNKKKKNYDFMSLDRKKKDGEKRNLDYLSLERNRDYLILNRKGKLKPTTLENFDEHDKKQTLKKNDATVIECKNNLKVKSEIGKGDLNEISKDKNRLLINKEEFKKIFEKKNNNTDIVKVLEENNLSKLNKNIAMTEIKEFQQGNIIKALSSTSIPKNNWELKFDSTITENLDDGEKNLKSFSPTSDVIYAQVVSGRTGKTHKPTVNERAVSDEVGLAIVSDKLNQFEENFSIKIDSDQSYKFFDKFMDNKKCQSKSDFLKEFGAKGGANMNENYENNLTRQEIFRQKSNEISSEKDDWLRAAQMKALKNEGAKPYSDLKNLSIRREILLNRSESQAKERYNSLKKIQEQTRFKKDVSNVENLQMGNEIIGNDSKYLSEDVKVNEKYANTLRKMPKDVELITSEARTKKESKWDSVTKQKDKDKFKNDKGVVHLIKTDEEDDNNNLLRKLNRLGKSKSFIEKKPKTKNKRMESMKMLFRKKKEGKNSESEDDALTSRYIAYRGSDIDLSYRNADSSSKKVVASNPLPSLESMNSGRKWLSTSSHNESTETVNKIKNIKNKELIRPSSIQNNLETQDTEKKKVEGFAIETTNILKPTTLRFFGDTDQESIAQDYILQQKLKHQTQKFFKTTDSYEELPNISNRSESRMTNSTLKGFSTGKYKTKYDLDRPDYGLKQMNHGLQMKNSKYDSIESSNSTNESFDINGLKYGPSIKRSVSSPTQSAKNTMSQKWTNLSSTSVNAINAKNDSFSKRVRTPANFIADEERIGRRRRQYDSSAESATEGDSSQHSLKSMIYLHAATVGDIPGHKNLYQNDRRSQSREELSSIDDNSMILTPNKKTLSRSISVLAPWRPRHNKEDKILYYDTVDYYKSKPPTGIGKKNSSSKDRKANELKFNTLRKENRRRKDVLR